ncbi:MAG: DUF1538 domain-containing protein [Bacilli bacterium]|jgi:hypothetical protein|nr:DUF1538 domain-containing protein [Acholeplasmataceae bacterium]
MVLSINVGELLLSMFDGFEKVILEVIIALLPLVAVFIVSQIFFLHYKKKKIIVVIKGTILSLIGLALFLQGVNVGYLPMATKMGEALGALNYLWIIVPIGFMMGFTTTLADPSIYVLAQESERASGGSIKRKFMFISLCFGVGFAVLIAMFKLLFGFSVVWIMIPGYTIAIILAYFVDPDFTAMAFDSGGVVTGTMVASFILPMSTGIASVVPERDPIIDGFGIVGLVALVPILTMLVMGLILNPPKRRKKEDKTSDN